MGSPFCACQIITTAVQVSTCKCGRGSYPLHACMRRRAGITSIFSYKFKILNNKEKPSALNRKNKPLVEIKTAQYVHDIELHFTEKEKSTQTRKLKRFLSKSKGCRVVKSTTDPQCKLTRNKHGMVTRLTC